MCYAVRESSKRLPEEPDEPLDMAQPGQHPKSAPDWNCSQPVVSLYLQVRGRKVAGMRHAGLCQSAACKHNWDALLSRLGKIRQRRALGLLAASYVMRIYLNPSSTPLQRPRTGRTPWYVNAWQGITSRYLVAVWQLLASSASLPTL